MAEMKPIIDISYWQRAIDYDELSEAVSGVILRAAYGVWADTWFEKHYIEFERRNKPIGTYHYLIGNYPGTRQAKLFYDVTEGMKFALGRWGDVEDQREGTKLSRRVVDEYTNEIEDMINRLIGIYTAKYAWDAIMGVPTYSHRDLWVANYGVLRPALPRTGGWTEYEFWQFTSKGRLPGYASDLDLNKFRGDEVEFESKYGTGGVIAPPPIVVPPDTKYCLHCGAYAKDDSNGCCSACGAPRIDPGVALTTMKVISPDGVRIRTTPNASSTTNIVRLRSKDEIIIVHDITVISPSSVWVKDAEGWSAVVHAGVKYLD